MKYSVLIPYRPDGEHRARAMAWVVGRWRALDPACEIVLGTQGDAGPWRKAVAIEDALRRATGDVLVIHDADAWSDRTPETAALVAGGAPWAVPHQTNYRLSIDATERVLAGADPETVARGDYALAEAPISDGRKIGGGIIVLPREVYEFCPMDPRFAGWGGEDEAFGWALETLHPGGKLLDGKLWHLWHPPAKRLSRVIGSRENDELRLRYYNAHWKPKLMRALVAEALVPQGSQDGVLFDSAVSP